MEGWQLGLIVVVVVGLAVIVVGAVRDRRITERRRREMLAPPQRNIPAFSPDAPSPAYLSELQAHRPPAHARPTDLTEEERDRLRTWSASAATTVVAAGYASDDLITDQPTRWAVLADAAVLVSDDGLGSLRELLGVLERQVPTGHPLVVVAPSISRELIGTFAVNHLQQLISVLPVVVASQQDRRLIAEVTDATVMTRADLQSGYLPEGTLGSCSTWMSTADRSYLHR